MNLVSCDTCATVLDADKLEFPENIWLGQEGAEEEIDQTKAVWSNEVDDFVPYVECPVCKNAVIQPKNMR